MENSYYFKSNVLNYLIGYFMLFEDDIILISPWLSDLEIKLPYNKRFNTSTINLSKLINKSKEKIASIIVSPDEHNNYLLGRITDEIKIKKIRDLHAKAIVSNKLVYIGSANITRSGTSKNTELCQLATNEFLSSRKFVEKRLRIRI